MIELMYYEGQNRDEGGVFDNGMLFFHDPNHKPKVPAMPRQDTMVDFPPDESKGEYTFTREDLDYYHQKVTELEIKTQLVKQQASGH